jgi:hypothetical protein
METKNYYKKKLDRITENLPTMKAEDLVDVLQLAYDEYNKFYRRDDCIPWSEENESIVTEIYFAVRREILNRLESDED